MLQHQQSLQSQSPKTCALLPLSTQIVVPGGLKAFRDAYLLSTGGKAYHSDMPFTCVTVHNFMETIVGSGDHLPEPASDAAAVYAVW